MNARVVSSHNHSVVYAAKYGSFFPLGVCWRRQEVYVKFRFEKRNWRLSYLRVIFRV